MKARLSIVICVAALFLLSVSFAYAQQMDSSVFIPAAFVPVVPQMGAEIPDPIIHILPYGQNGSKRIFSVGEPLNIGVENATGAKIWYVRRRPPGMDSAGFGRTPSEPGPSGNPGFHRVSSTAGGGIRR